MLHTHTKVKTCLNILIWPKFTRIFRHSIKYKKNAIEKPLSTYIKNVNILIHQEFSIQTYSSKKKMKTYQHNNTQKMLTLRATLPKIKFEDSKKNALQKTHTFCLHFKQFKSEHFSFFKKNTNLHQNFTSRTRRATPNTTSMHARLGHFGGLHA